jgi:hypothetical protein
MWRTYRDCDDRVPVHRSSECCGGVLSGTKRMVGASGFEPPASCSELRVKNHISRCPGVTYWFLTAPRWTKRSYSFPKPGEVTRAGPLLHAGFLKRIHFAGEHTCYAFTGYMEAALQSGIRVAEQIARRDEVLGRKRRTRSRRSHSKTTLPSTQGVVTPSPS